MEEQKMKKVRNAVIVGAVLLIIILLSVLIFQLAKISSEKKKLKRLEEEIAKYQLLTEEERETLEAMQTLDWIVQTARELGLTLPGDIPID